MPSERGVCREDEANAAHGQWIFLDLCIILTGKCPNRTQASARFDGRIPLQRSITSFVVRGCKGGIFMKRFSTRNLVTLSVLVALQVILTRFCSFNAWNVRIGLGFTALVIAGIFYGPVAAALVGGLGDFIGAVAFPTGPYFPGFTLTQVLMGAVFGLMLYQKHSSEPLFSKASDAGASAFSLRTGSASMILRIAVAVLINQCILSLLLNTFWISFVYGSSFTGLLATRAMQAAVTAPIQMIIIYVLSSVLKRADIRNVLAI